MKKIKSNLIVKGTNYDCKNLICRNINNSLKTGNKVLLITNYSRTARDEFHDLWYYDSKPNSSYYDVISVGFPYDFLKVDSDASEKELERILFEKLSLTGEYSINQLYDIKSVVNSYVDDNINTIRENGCFDIEKVEDILHTVEQFNNNDSDEHERISNLFYDIRYCCLGCGEISMSDFLRGPEQFRILHFDPDFFYTTAIISYMVLSDVLNHQRKNKNAPLDLYFEEISAENIHITSQIKKLIDESEAINLTFTGVLKK